MKAGLHCYVTGKVQGVCFRSSTKKEAERIGLNGFVRNLPDGRVEVMFCGDADKVREFRIWLEKGPPLAIVEKIEEEEVAWKEYSGFRVV